MSVTEPTYVGPDQRSAIPGIGIEFCIKHFAAAKKTIFISTSNGSTDNSQFRYQPDIKSSK